MLFIGYILAILAHFSTVYSTRIYINSREHNSGEIVQNYPNEYLKSGDPNAAISSLLLGLINPENTSKKLKHILRKLKPKLRNNKKNSLRRNDEEQEIRVKIIRDFLNAVHTLSKSKVVKPDVKPETRDFVFINDGGDVNYNGRTYRGGEKGHLRKVNYVSSKECVEGSPSCIKVVLITPKTPADDPGLWASDSDFDLF